MTVMPGSSSGPSGPPRGALTIGCDDDDETEPVSRIALDERRSPALYGFDSGEVVECMERRLWTAEVDRRRRTRNGW